ncbi:MAG: rRNA pseudouridine synthase [Bacteroidales bacterium]|nr:rRNA pseudouridine synthase [Bacteroidales bacterium]
MVRVIKRGRNIRESDGSVRLNRYIASSGICSRRDADELISQGVVEINGKKVTEFGTQVKPGDSVKVKGKTIKNERRVYILLNKPKDTLTTMDDPEGRRTVMDLVHKATKERIFPVGRLDRNTTGVLLLTNDGELAAHLTHPRYQIKKVYEIKTDAPVSEEAVKKLLEGIELEDGITKADSVAVPDPGFKNYLHIEIHSGKNRIIRRMFEALNIGIIKLDRISFAGLTKKNLARGRWRHLTTREVGWLKMSKK